MVMGSFSWQTLAHEARDLLERELERRFTHGAETAAGPWRANGGALDDTGRARWPVDVELAGVPAPRRSDARSHWLLPELARLLAEHHDRPAEEFAFAVRELITERQFVGAAGDPVSAEREGAPQREQDVRDWLALALRAHRRLRRRVRPDGAWAHVPTPPLMFG